MKPKTAEKSDSTEPKRQNESTRERVLEGAFTLFCEDGFSGGEETPYAAGKEKSDGSDGDTTPGIKKLSPMNRNVWGTANAISASDRCAIRSRGADINLSDDAKGNKTHQDTERE
jgi:hypothetical protein